MIYTVFLFTNQRIFYLLPYWGIEMEEIVGCSLILCRRRPPRGPYGRSRFPLRAGPVTFVMPVLEGCQFPPRVEV